MTDSWLFDCNALVALALGTHVHHRAAHRALNAHQGIFATSPATESCLIRLLLNPAVTGRVFTRHEALQALADVRSHSRWRHLPDSASFADPRISLTALTHHSRATDLHLLNLCAGAGFKLATFDAKLSQFISPEDRQHLVLLRL